MLEVVVVGIVVTIAIAYTVWTLVPAGTRVSLVRRLARATSQGNPPPWLSRLVARLEAAANQGTGPCRDCDAHPPTQKNPPP